MKRIGIITWTATMAASVPALASDGQAATWGSPLVWLLLGFGALIVVCQLIPGLVLFCAMIKGLFEGGAKGTLPKTGAKTA